MAKAPYADRSLERCAECGGAGGTICPDCGHASWIEDPLASPAPFASRDPNLATVRHLLAMLATAEGATFGENNWVSASWLRHVAEMALSFCPSEIIPEDEAEARLFLGAIFRDIPPTVTG